MKLFFVLAGFLFWGQLLHAQTEEATTKSGRKVILYTDGTWKYADEPVKAENKPVVAEKPKKTIIKPVESKVATVPENCSELFETIEERKSGITTIRTKNMMILTEDNSSKEIDLLLQKNSKGIISLVLHMIGAGDCIGDGNKVNIVYEDGSKTELNHDGFPNCNGEITISFGGNYGKKKQLEDLSLKKIKSIKAWTQKGTIQENLTAENQADFQKAMNCLLSN